MASEDLNGQCALPTTCLNPCSLGMIRPCGVSYVMDHAVTAVQKEILKAFDMNETKIRKQAQELSALIDSIEKNDKVQCSERSES